jgi:hypothetical protein|tara:strand:+ start:8 stop:256 length:249 start_codon:yes stop_codon:yes gene_type:complete
MSFIEQEASIRYEIINGEKIPVIKPKIEITLKNLKTGKEYASDAEALQDVQNVATDTKPEDVSRSVKAYIAHIPFGAKTNIF